MTDASLLPSPTGPGRSLVLSAASVALMGRCSGGRSSLPVTWQTRCHQKRAFDRHLDQLDLVVILVERPGALGGGAAGGGGGGVGHRMAFHGTGGGLGYMGSWRDVAKNDLDAGGVVARAREGDRG